MSVLEFLSKKPLYYAKIDYERMPRIYKKHKDLFPLPPVVHIVGTNGKGSTGRWLALMLRQSGKKVGHFTSPHVLEFNERFWIDGENVSYDRLDFAHQKVLDILGSDADKLSYFEYSTFLAAYLFCDCEYVILEAGLGGEYDATNVFKKRLSIITAIGHDHGDFLGYTLKSITTTKVNSITTTSIIAPQNDDVITQCAQKIADSKKVELLRVDKDEKNNDLNKYIKRYNYPEFLKNNLLTSYKALKFLNKNVDFEKLPPLDLKGRFEKIAPNITLDVGHNPLSAKRISQCFGKKSIVLVYNSFKDKDIYDILSNLFPIISEVKVIKLTEVEREIGEEQTIEALEKLGLKWSYFDNRIDKTKEYLVYGSFHVGEKFLKTVKFE